MSVNFEKAHAIFLAAVERNGPDEQMKYLDDACGEDRELRQHLEILLNAHGQSGSFLEKGALVLGPTLDQPITEKPGTQIGPYKLLQQLGEGGMGVVYLAEQKEPVKRRVALKIIKPGMDTRQVIARFEAERQALAMMDHPNIAKVLDAGQTESGRPYFVMELVNGLPVTKYCDQQHLNPQERLELFVPICQAVQHAHQKGIIHRDLKPSNILVAMYDNRAVPKVIDFGVAKATSQTLTEKTMFTQLGEVVGTLEYMSPEQAQRNQLDIDTRSDVYSLGVVLYELLTGETPFDRKRLRSAAFEEILRIIREEEPSKPSTKVSGSQSLPSIAANRRIEPAKLSRMIRGELDWIVLKAMDKERGRRYESANSLALDVQRYLTDEPVMACPPSAAYRFRKFARRNQGSLVAAAVLTGALLVSTIGIGYAVRDRIARQAQVERERTERVDRARAQILPILDNANRLIAELRWTEALDTAKRAEAVVAGGESDEEMQTQAATLVRELEFVERLEKARMVSASWIGDSFDHLAGCRAFSKAFREFGVDVDQLSPVACLARLPARPEDAQAIAAAVDAWVSARRELEKRELEERELEGLGPAWEQLVEIARGLDPDPIRDQLRSLLKEPDAEEASRQLRELVDTYEPHKMPPATVVALSGISHQAGHTDLTIRVLSLGQRDFPADYWLNFWLGSRLLNDKNDGEKAIRFLTAAVALRPDSTAALNNLGNCLADLNLIEEAIVYYQAAIRLDSQHARAWNNLGLARFKQGKTNESITCYRKAIDLDPHLVCALSNLSAPMLMQGKTDEARALCTKAIELEPDFTAAHVALGNALRQQGKLVEATASYRKAIELDPKYAHAHYNLGIVLKQQGELEQAIAGYRKAIELDPHYAEAHTNLGVTLGTQGKVDEAISHYRKAIEIDPNLSAAHRNLGATLADHGRIEEAIASHRKAIETAPNDATMYNSFGATLSNHGKLEEATAPLRKAIELDPNFADAHFNLGVTLERQEKWDDAIASYRRALQHAPQHYAAHHRLVNVLRELGRIEEAIARHRKAIETVPNDKFMYSSFGATLSDHGRLEEAIAPLRKAIELDPSYAEAHIVLAITLGRQEKWDDAIASFQTALEHAPQFSAAHFNLANVLRDQGRIDEAIPHYRQAIQFGMRSGISHAAFAEALLASENLQPDRAREALENAREAVRFFPKLPQALTLLAKAAQECAEWEESRTVLLQLVEVAEPQVEEQLSLALAFAQLGEFDAAQRWYQTGSVAFAALNEPEQRLQSLKREVEDLLNSQDGP